MLGNDDDAAVIRQALHVAGDVVAGHHIQDDVHAAPTGGVHDFLHEVLRLVVDALFGAQRFDGTGAVVAADRRIDLVAHCAGQLDRRGADAACSAVHQQDLA
ncbi:hypothetical protein G6F62_014960 [Rhizopus arrhizus]|nr:hypothetical protein G6F62_014960 [Rhizopus arrhizus]